ncbi:MAG TPA: mechanosensitive ion channel domain-containing protein [Spongiibacteraceae bacterium]|nr:mechanosensitive ion channel domain-containing protein [Spongiibacteraceae bacterium]
MTHMTVRVLALFCTLYFLPLTSYRADAVESDAGNSGAVTAGVDVHAESNESAAPAEVRFMNRHIVTFHATISGVSPAARAQRATEQLEHLNRRELMLPLDTLNLSIDNEPMQGIRLGGHLLFVLAQADVGPGDPHGFEALVGDVQRQLSAALHARTELGRWPNLLRGLGFSVVATALLGGLIKLLIVARQWLQARLQQVVTRHISEAGRSRFNWATSVLQLVTLILRLLLGGMVLVLMYGWLTFVLKQFLLTEPLGDRLSGFFVDLLLKIAQGMLNALPGLITMFVIFSLAKAFRDLLGNFFDNVARGGLNFPGMHPDTIGATRRIASGVIWVLGLTFAYPYIPGSQTEVFKGLSVLVGLILTLGSSSLVNQLMSGMTLIYSRSMRKGDLVRIGDVTGLVEEVNALSVKLLRINEEITVPNAVVVSNTVLNYSRMVRGPAAVLSATVTIGYDTPWRQVHALLGAAATTTSGVAQNPAPLVLQRALSDFFVEYELQVTIADASLYVEVMSRLHANIQDHFNEHGIQIMSPHFVIQPTEPLVVPRENWFEKPGGKTS